MNLTIHRASALIFLVAFGTKLFFPTDADARGEIVGASIIPSGPNSRTVEWAEYRQSSSGRVISTKHHYVELATGMYYLKDGKWLESRELIEPMPNGGAAATEGQYQVYFPANLYSGVLELVTPDGVHLKSRPIAMIRLGIY